MEFLVWVGTAIKSTKTSRWDKTQNDCIHLSPTLARYTVQLKMHALSSCFISAASFSTFYCNAEFFSYTCLCKFSSYAIVYLLVYNRNHLLWQNNNMAMMWWLDWLQYFSFWSKCMLSCSSHLKLQVTYRVVFLKVFIVYPLL